MEDNKEIMTVENEELEPVEDKTEEVQSNFGAGIVIGGALALAIYAGVKKLLAIRKERKEKEPMVHKTDPNVIDITPDEPVDSDEETE